MLSLDVIRSDAKAKRGTSNRSSQRYTEKASPSGPKSISEHCSQVGRWCI